MLKSKMSKIDIKILSFDLDGTLLTSQKLIDKKTLKWIDDHEAQFAILIFASGRKYDQITPYVQLFKEEVQKKMYIVSSGGGFIYAPNGNKIWSAERMLAKDATSLCKCVLSKLPKTGCTIVTEACDYAVHSKLNFSVIVKNTVHAIKGVQDFKNVDLIQASKINDDIEKIIFHTTKITNIANALVETKDYSINLIESKQVDVRLKSVNKSGAILHLLEQQGFSRDNILTFGDDENDFDVFDTFPLCVAMENASYEIKRRAKFITDSNDNYGIANFLVRFFEEMYDGAEQSFT